MADNLTKEQKWLEKLQKVTAELIETEKSYVDSLDRLITVGI